MRRALARHRIELPRCALEPGLFADYFSTGSPELAPLVCFWGGAISRAEYERGRGRRPDAILAEWRAAMAGRRRPPDLLVFSLPDVRSCTSADLRVRAVEAFRQVLAASPDPCPPAIGYAAHSAGSFMALSLALGLPQSRAVATLGGVGMVRAAAEAPLERLRGLTIVTFVNDDDPCTGQSVRFLAALRARGVAGELRRGAGGHELEAYAANGSVRDAFAFVTERLMDSRAPCAPARSRAQPVRGLRHSESALPRR